MKNYFEDKLYDSYKGEGLVEKVKESNLANGVKEGVEDLNNYLTEGALGPISTGLGIGSIASLSAAAGHALYGNEISSVALMFTSMCCGLSTFSVDRLDDYLDWEYFGFRK